MKNQLRDFRVYMAGAIQGESLLHSLSNLERGQQWTAHVFNAGLSPFPVFCDYVFLQKANPVPRIEHVYAYSMAWLHAADAVFLVPGYEKSKGTALEIEQARKQNIPVFADLHDLVKWAETEIAYGMQNVDEVLARSDD